MKLELKHIAPYLPYKVLVGDGRTPFELTEHNFTNIYRYINVIYLRPLSDITKEIEVNGEKFVPIKKLTYYSDILNHVIKYPKEYQALINLKFCMIQNLLEWHFDIYGLIENGLAVDINTL